MIARNFIFVIRITSSMLSFSEMIKSSEGQTKRERERERNYVIQKIDATFIHVWDVRWRSRAQRKRTTRPQMNELDWMRVPASRSASNRRAEWLMHSGKYFQRAWGLPCSYATLLPIVVAAARDALGRTIRTRLITCICNCSNVTAGVINRATNPLRPIDRSTKRSVEFRSTYHSRATHPMQQSMIFLSGDAETAEQPKKRVMPGRISGRAGKFHLPFHQRVRG